MFFYGDNSLNIDSNERDQLSLEEIELSIEKIKSKFAEVDRLIKNESSNIDQLFVELIQELNLKNETLKRMQDRELQLLQRIEYFEDLSSLSEEQTKAIVQALDRNKNYDLAISFVIGFCSSLLVWALSQLKLIKAVFVNNESKRIEP